MVQQLLSERITGGKDWATALFLVCFVLIVVNRSISSSRFAEFTRLAFSDKYNKIYKDSSNILTGFTISFFAVQVISFAFLIQFLLSYRGITEKTNWVSFVQIVTGISVFILSKYLIEKIIATTFKVEEFSEQFNLQKVNYRTYIAMLLLPVNIILFYNNITAPLVIYIIFGLIILAGIASYLVSLRIYQKLILSKLFYFILYLCTLEIAPYYFLYYWFTKTR